MHFLLFASFFMKRKAWVHLKSDDGTVLFSFGNATYVTEKYMCLSALISVVMRNSHMKT